MINNSNKFGKYNDIVAHLTERPLTLLSKVVDIGLVVIAGLSITLLVFGYFN